MKLFCNCLGSGGFQLVLSGNSSSQLWKHVFLSGCARFKSLREERERETSGNNNHKNLFFLQRGSLEDIQQVGGLGCERNEPEMLSELSVAGWDFFPVTLVSGKVASPRQHLLFPPPTSRHIRARTVSIFHSFIVFTFSSSFPSLHALVNLFIRFE
jgi:hypothetical protein